MFSDIKKMFAEVSEDVHAAAEEHIERINRSGERYGDRLIFESRHGTRYKCIDSKRSIENMLRNIARDTRRISLFWTTVNRVKNPVSLKQGNAQNVIDEFIYDGEIENAMTYAELRGVRLLFKEGPGGPVPLTKVGKLRDKQLAPLADAGVVLTQTPRRCEAVHTPSGSVMGWSETPCCLEPRLRSLVDVGATKLKPHVIERIEGFRSDYQEYATRWWADKIEEREAC